MTTWPPPGPMPPTWPVLSPGAAWAADVLFRRYGDGLLAVLAVSPDPEMRHAGEQFAAAARSVHAAAEEWLSRRPGCGGATAEPVEARPAPAFNHDAAGLSTADVAELLGCSGSYVRRLAPAWAEDGHAQRVGGRWVFDRYRVLVEAGRRGLRSVAA